MRSYYAHLATTASSTDGAIAPRPTFRTSAIFPVMQKADISSRILFMGYWILKRHIREMAAVATLRDLTGKVLARQTFLITEAKTFRIELSDEMARAGLDRHAQFEGSMEVEFFSTQNLFFPYPAAVINYYGPKFSTVVHTAQRVYNDFDDMLKNSQKEVPESGFNLYADDEREPFIGLINGCAPVANSKMRMEFLNLAQEKLETTFDLGPLEPYETRWIYPAHHCNLKKFLKNQPGAGKIHFQVEWIFPRLVVGNIHHKIPALTITHTYYDCSDALTDSDYWRPEEAGWHAAALMLPGEIANQHFTNIYFYPIYSPAKFAIDAQVYSSDGKCLGTKKDAAIITAPTLQMHRIPLQEVLKTLGIGVQQDCGLRLIARPLDGTRIPARIKLGLDVGNRKEINTPCNICTNMQPFNPSLEQKPTSFRWSPVLADQPQATLWFMNSSPAVDYQRPAEITVTFFRESDSKTLTRQLALPPQGFAILRIADDKELNDFFQGKVGWMTATTTNPYTTTYYFAENSSGVVGGDHGF